MIVYIRRPCQARVRLRLSHGLYDSSPARSQSHSPWSSYTGSTSEELINEKIVRLTRKNKHSRSNNKEVHLGYGLGLAELLTKSLLLTLDFFHLFGVDFSELALVAEDVRP